MGIVLEFDERHLNCAAQGGAADINFLERLSMATDSNGNPIRGIVFDVFGTLVQRNEWRHPYRQMLALAAEAGRIVQPDDAAKIMSMDRDIFGIAEWLGLDLTEAIRAGLETDLAVELANISLFPDAKATLESLRGHGIQIGLCSNLAQPYAAPVRSLLPFTLDAYAWSFEVGAVKPEALIYQTVCRTLNLPPREVLMIGDTYVADCQSPREFGMQALHLARNGGSPDSTFIRSLVEVHSHIRLDGEGEGRV